MRYLHEIIHQRLTSTVPGATNIATTTNSIIKSIIGSLHYILGSPHGASQTGTVHPKLPGDLVEMQNLTHRDLTFGGTCKTLKILISCPALQRI